MINNNRYNKKQFQNIGLANKNLNNINYNFNKDYSYEVINGNMINNLVTNKSANKNENSNRKNRNNIPSKNFLRTNGFRRFPIKI